MRFRKFRCYTCVVVCLSLSMLNGKLGIPQVMKFLQCTRLVCCKCGIDDNQKPSSFANHRLREAEIGQLAHRISNVRQFSRTSGSNPSQAISRQHAWSLMKVHSFLTSAGHTNNMLSCNIVTSEHKRRNRSIALLSRTSNNGPFIASTCFQYTLFLSRKRG